MEEWGCEKTAGELRKQTLSCSSILLGIFSPAGLPGTALLEAGLLPLKTYFLYYLSPQNCAFLTFCYGKSAQPCTACLGRMVCNDRAQMWSRTGACFFHPWAAYLLSVAPWQAKLAVRCSAPTRCPH